MAMLCYAAEKAKEKTPELEEKVVHFDSEGFETKNDYVPPSKTEKVAQAQR